MCSHNLETYRGLLCEGCKKGRVSCQEDPTLVSMPQIAYLSGPPACYVYDETIRL